MDTRVTSPHERLSFIRKVLFGIADSTNSLFFTVIAFFYLYFLTDTAGLAPLLSG